MTSQTGRDLTDDVCFDVQCSGGSTPIDGECVEDTLSCSITVIPQ